MSRSPLRALPVPIAAETGRSETSASRRHILDCAARLIREHGYAATSLRDIAAASGIKAGSLYYYFASKEEIVTEMLNIGVQTAFGEVRRSIEALNGASGASQIETAIRAHMRAIFEIDDYNGASIRIFGQVPQRVRDAALGERDAYERYWLELIEQEVRAGKLRPGIDRTLLRLFLFGAMNSALEWYNPGGKHSLDEVSHELSQIILRGIGGGSAVPPARRRRTSPRATGKR
jgi:AcrR family transcriptional regulator